MSMRDSATSARIVPCSAIGLPNATRDITVRDLLTHTSGLMSSGGPANGASIAVPPPQHGDPDTLANYIPKLGAVPRDDQPGTMWRDSRIAGFEALTERLAQGITALNLSIDAAMQRQMLAYATLIVEWNRVHGVVDRCR